MKLADIFYDQYMKSLSNDELCEAFIEVADYQNEPTEFRDSEFKPKSNGQLCRIANVLHELANFPKDNYDVASEYILMEIGRRFVDLVGHAPGSKQWIQIWYSWGDQESPVEIPENTDAWEYMKALVLKEAEVSQEDHDCENGIQFYPEEQKIVLHYGYDDEFCYYQITESEDFDPFSSGKEECGNGNND